MGNLSPEQWRALQKPARRSKYKNKRVKAKGDKPGFDSMAEEAYWDEVLMAGLQGGLYCDVRRSPTIYLSDAKIGWKVDFRVTLAGSNVFEWHEVKGFETEAYRLKLKLWRAYGPGTLHIIKGRAGSFRVYDTVVPGLLLK